MNADTYLKFNHAIFNKRVLYIGLLLSLALFALAIIFVDAILFIGSIVLFVFYIYLTIYLKIAIKRHLKSNKRIGNNIVCVHTIVDGTVTEEIHDSDKVVEKSEYRITDLFKVIETPEYFYLFITNRSAYIISKNGIRQGTAYELGSTLKAALLPKKYKTKNK